MEPAEIILACADYGQRLENLQWSRWTATEAKAVGVYAYNDCTPSCANGHFHDVPNTNITLTSPVRGAGGHVVWSRFVQTPAQLDYQGHPIPEPYALVTRPV